MLFAGGQPASGAAAGSSGDMPAEQFILETTGLANPANVMEALSELRDIVQPGLVITVADALDLCRSEGDIAGIRRAQAARADVIILNKADTVEPAALEALAERLRALNRQALILPARHGAVAFAELDAFYADWADRRGTPLPSHRPALPRFGETVTHADEGFVSAALRLSAPLDEAALLALLDGAGPGLCRAKGVVDLRLDGGVTVPATVQYAAGRLGFEPPRKARNAIWCSSARIFPCRKRRLRKGGACGADRTWAAG